MRTSVFSLSALSCLLTSSAFAASVSYTDSSGLVAAPTTTLSLQLFDPALGNLHKVRIDYDVEFVGTFVMGSADLGGTGSGLGNDDFITFMLSTGTSTAFGGLSVLQAKDGSAFNVRVPPVYQQNVSGQASGVREFDAGLPGMIGTGFGQIEFNAVANPLIATSVNVVGSVQDLMFNVSTTVTYTFDGQTVSPVPLPASAPLVLFGLACLWGSRRHS